jgi:hypothetical protein
MEILIARRDWGSLSSAVERDHSNTAKQDEKLFNGNQ